MKGIHQKTTVNLIFKRFRSAFSSSGVVVVKFTLFVIGLLASFFLNLAAGSHHK